MANHIRKKRIEKNLYAYFDFMEKHGIPVVQVARHSSLRSDFARERRAVDESIRLKYIGQYIYIYIHSQVVDGNWPICKRARHVSTCDVNDRRSIESSAVVTSQCDRAWAWTLERRAIIRFSAIIRDRKKFFDRPTWRIDEQSTSFPFSRRVKPRAADL